MFNIVLLIPALAVTFAVYLVLEWLIWRSQTQLKRQPIPLRVRNHGRRPGDGG
jgi:hypothetical protein